MLTNGLDGGIGVSKSIEMTQLADMTAVNPTKQRAGSLDSANPLKGCLHCQKRQAQKDVTWQLVEKSRERSYRC